MDEGRLIRELFVTGRLYPWVIGGTGQVQYHLTRSLSSSGKCGVTLLGTYPLGEKFPFHLYSGIDVRPIPTPGGRNSLGDLLASNVAFPFSMMETEYDIVHLNVLPGLRVLTLTQFVKRRNAKLIVNVHGVPDEVNMIVGDPLFRFFAKIHWSVSVGKFSWVDAFVVNSNWVKQHMNGLLPAERVFVIPNGVPSNLFTYALPTRDDGKTILCFGDIVPVKGKDLLIRAFASSRLSRSHTLLFIGNSNFGTKERLCELAKNLGVESNTRFLPAMSRNELVDVIRDSVVCVTPSRLEPFGIPVLEAMALGKTVIATRFGGPADFVSDGVDGFLIDPRDTEAFADLLGRVCCDESLRHTVGALARRKAERYAWERIAQLYLDLYRRLLK